MERLLLYEVSKDGEHYSQQWLTVREVERHRGMGFKVRCSFCAKVDQLNNNESCMMCPGRFGAVHGMRNDDGNPVIVGFLESAVTSVFPMNYCPKCGRRL